MAPGTIVSPSRYRDTIVRSRADTRATRSVASRGFQFALGCDRTRFKVYLNPCFRHLPLLWGQRTRGRDDSCLVVTSHLATRSPVQQGFS